MLLIGLELCLLWRDTGQDINFEFGALGCLRHCSAGKAVEISGEKAARATLLPPGTLSHPSLHWLKRRHIKLFITFQIKNVIFWFFIKIINVRCCACSVATECSWLCQTFAHKKFNWCPCVLCFAVETVIRAIWSKIHIFLHLNINLKHGEVTCGDAEQEKKHKCYLLQLAHPQC